MPRARAVSAAPAPCPDGSACSVPLLARPCHRSLQPEDREGGDRSGRAAPIQRPEIAGCQLPSSDEPLGGPQGRAGSLRSGRTWPVAGAAAGPPSAPAERTWRGCSVGNLGPCGPQKRRRPQSRPSAPCPHTFTRLRMLAVQCLRVSRPGSTTDAGDSAHGQACNCSSTGTAAIAVLRGAACEHRCRLRGRPPAARHPGGEPMPLILGRRCAYEGLRCAFAHPSPCAFFPCVRAPRTRGNLRVLGGPLPLTIIVITRRHVFTARLGRQPA